MPRDVVTFLNSGCGSECRYNVRGASFSCTLYYLQFQRVIAICCGFVESCGVNTGLQSQLAISRHEESKTQTITEVMYSKQKVEIENREPATLEGGSRMFYQPFNGKVAHDRRRRGQGYYEAPRS